MTIQSPTILRRFGNVTASGTQVVPDPMRSMLTPAGPIIMSSAVWPCIPGMLLPGMFIPGVLLPGMFIGAESGFAGMFDILDMSMPVESLAAGGMCCMSIGAADDFSTGAALAGIGIAIVGDAFFAPTAGLLAAFAPAFFFDVFDAGDFVLAVVFFFAVLGAPIFMPAGIVLSCAGGGVC